MNISWEVMFLRIFLKTNSQKKFLKHILQKVRKVFHIFVLIFVIILSVIFIMISTLIFIVFTAPIFNHFL